MFPAVKVPCANWDDELGDPRPSPPQDYPGFPRPLTASFFPSMGLRWSVVRGEEFGGGGFDSRLRSAADHIRNGSLWFLHKFCSFIAASALIRLSRDTRRDRRQGVTDKRQRVQLCFCFFISSLWCCYLLLPAVFVFLQHRCCPHFQCFGCLFSQFN